MREFLSEKEWDFYKEAQKSRRETRLPIRRRQILGLRSKGFNVRELTPYQYRINGEIDVYPIHNKFHNLKSGRRGGYKDVEQFIDRHFHKRK